MQSNLLKRISILTFASVLTLTAGSPLFAKQKVNFASETRLNKGKWIKIGVPSGGVCRISYDKLREMGFSSPEKVAVFGRGGTMYNGNFTDATGNLLYSDAINAVGTLHRDNSLYFYALGPAELVYTASGVDRTSNNVYTTKAYYFLSDSQTDAAMIKQADASVPSSPANLYTSGIGYQLIEEDNLYPYNTGEDYFGWELASLPSRSITLPYNLPGSEQGATLKIAGRGAAKITGPEKFSVTLKSGSDEQTIGTINFNNYDPDAYYTYNANGYSSFLSGTLPGAEGSLTVATLPNKLSTFAALDFLVLSAPRNLSFQSGETSFEVFVPDYTEDKGPIAIGAAPSDLVVWDVANPNDVVSLPYTIASDGTAYAAGMRDGKSGRRLVAFSASAPLVNIDSYKEVSNQNLHALASGETPVMLIITTPELKSEAERLAELHRTYQNEKVVVVLSEEVINEFSQGTPDPMAYKAITRMLYDADKGQERTFSSILLFGPMRADNRGISKPLPAHELLLCKETPNGDAATTSFTIPDFYVQMKDYYSSDESGYNYYARTQDLAVGVIPADSQAVAKLYVDKVESWLTDTSVASWLTDVIYTADGSNANEHILECDAAATLWSELDNAFTPSKLYNHAYPDSDIRTNFVKVMNRGAMWSNYLGHASHNGLNTLLWDKGNYRLLTNNRLGFMFLGGCTISDFDQGNRGSGEEMILSTPHGLMGALITNRVSRSMSNYTLLTDLINSAMKDDPFGTTDSDRRLSAPRTFGEITRMAMSANTRANTNKLAYTLICDPALISLMPSAAVDVTLASEGDNTGVYPGSRVNISAVVKDRDGKKLDSFNGNAVVNLYAPPYVSPTRSVGDSPAIDITHVNDLLSSTPFEVKDGVFSGSVYIPSNAGSIDNELRLSIAAFDISTRRTATGSNNLTLLPFTEGKSEVDTEAPIVENFYVDRPDFVSGDVVSDKPVIYAVLTDNVALNYNSTSPDSNLSLSFDGKRADTNIGQFVTIADEGRKMIIRYPAKDLYYGMHTATIKGADLAGNPCSATIQFNVQTYAPTATTVEASAALVRDKATLTVATAADAGYTTAAKTLIITDPLGNIVRTANVDGDTAEWDVCDMDGKRVAEGIYYARCRYITGAGATGITDPVRLIVIRPSKTDD